MAATRTNREGADALVIFAHSRKVVPSLPPTRLVFHVEAANAAGGYATYDPSLERLAKMKIYLFTVGCPLRQLYGLRFPYIYGYVHKSHRLGPSWSYRTWVSPAGLNAYRTGDYVGRYLWRTADEWTPAGKVTPETWNPPTTVPENVFGNGPRTEFAIGPGAHTHYWDNTADQVADTLDAIIARA